MYQTAENCLIMPLYKTGKRLIGRQMIKRSVKRKKVGAGKWKIVIGADGIFQQGWIPTEVETLNLLKPRDWERYFSPDGIDAILAEHVWEHLTLEDGHFAARMCYRYLKPGGYVRVAVPDGLHPDPEYIDHVKIGGHDAQKSIGIYGPDSVDHKVLYTYKTLEEVFKSAGFRVDFLEYFDHEGEFRYKDWHPGDGLIHRSKRFDHRNKDGGLGFTSIIIDATK